MEQEHAVQFYLRQTTPDGRRLYAKAGGYGRGLVVGLGRVFFRVQRVKEKATGRTFAPLAKVPALAHRTIGPDVRLSMAEDVLELSCRKASRRFEDTPLKEDPPCDCGS